MGVSRCHQRKTITGQENIKNKDNQKYEDNVKHEDDLKIKTISTIMTNSQMKKTVKTNSSSVKTRSQPGQTRPNRVSAVHSKFQMRSDLRGDTRVATKSNWY